MEGLMDMKNRMRQKWIYQVKGHSFEHPPRGSVLYESPPEDDVAGLLLSKRKMLIFLGVLSAVSILLQGLFWFAGENNGSDNKKAYKTDLTQISAYYHNLFAGEQGDEASTEVKDEKLNQNTSEDRP
jgi:hypothetical protein